MRRLLTLLSAAVALLASSAALAKPPRLESPAWADRGASIVAPLGDGRTIVAWQSPDAVVHTVSADGTERTVAPPADCDPNLMAAGAGAVLFACRPPGTDHHGDRFAVVRAATGVVHVFRGPGSGGGGEVWWPRAMGPVWIEGWTEGYRVNVSEYLRYDGSGLVLGIRHTAALVPDLSLPQLWRPLCGGLRLRRWLEETYNTEDPLGPGVADATFAAVSDDRGWRVRRCRTGREIRLPREASAPLLGGGLATWVEGPRTLGVLQADGRRRRVAKPLSTSEYGWSFVRAGRRLAFGDAAETVDGRTQWRVWTTTLPRR